METAVTFEKIFDTSLYDFKGTRTPVKRYVFYIGTHGPFTEDVPLAAFDMNEIQRRIQALQTHLTVIGG